MVKSEMPKVLPTKKTQAGTLKSRFPGQAVVAVNIAVPAVKLLLIEVLKAISKTRRRFPRNCLCLQRQAIHDDRGEDPARFRASG